MKLPPDLQRRLTESDQHLQAYLAVVPRRGADVVLHASARTAGELADRLEEIAGEIRERLPRDCISSAGWFQAVDLPWVDYAFMENVPEDIDENGLPYSVVAEAQRVRAEFAAADASACLSCGAAPGMPHGEACPELHGHRDGTPA